MLLFINERIYPQMCVAVGIALIAVATLYLISNDSIKHHNWTYVTGELLDKNGRRLDVSYTDEEGYEHIVEASYVTRDWRIYYPPQEGDPVALRYNPANPEEVVISFLNPARYLMLGFLGFIFLYGCVYFIQGIRYWP